MKLIKKTKLSKYAVILPSPRVTPTNSLSNDEWNSKSLNNRKTIARCSSKKIKYNVIAIAGGITIAMIIIIVVLVPLSTSQSTTAKSTVSVISVALFTNMLVTSTNSITTTLSSTETTSTTASTSIFTISETTTTTYSATISTTSTVITASTTTFTGISTTTTETATSTTAAASTATFTVTVTDTSTITSETITPTTTTESTTTSTSTTTSETTTSTTTSSTTTSSSSTTTTSVTISPLQWNTTGITVAGSLSSTSATPNYLFFPIGIVIDSSDTLYVTDAKNNRIQQFALGNTTGKTVAGQSNGAVGSNASFLDYPNDVAVDSNGNVYVVDSYNNRVQLWYANSSSGITIAGNDTAGNSLTLLNSSRGIAFDPNTDTFYVSDTYNNRVMSYTLNSTVGTLVAGGNGPGNNYTQLNDPRGLYFDASTNSLIIANNGAHNIVRWIIGASNWTLVAGNLNGVAGNGSMAFNNPYDVTLDPMGNMYVADRYNDRIQFFLAGESNGSTIAGVTAQSGNGPNYFNGPLSVALDSQLNVYVADSSNNRIQKFSRYS